MENKTSYHLCNLTCFVHLKASNHHYNFNYFPLGRQLSKNTIILFKAHKQIYIYTNDLNTAHGTVPGVVL